MQSRIKRNLLYALSVISFNLCLSSVAAAEVAVIVHPSNTSTIEKADIERMFMGKTKKFSSGEDVIPTNATVGMSSRDEFEEKVIGRSNSQITAYWAKLIFTGKGTKPDELASDAEIIAMVAKTKGAIAYVDAASVNDSVKVVVKY